MTRPNVFHSCAVVILLIVVCSARLVASEPTPRFELRAGDGTVVLCDDDICSYDWSTHTLTLLPKVLETLRPRLIKEGRLISGIPFSVTVGGQTIYAGKITSAESSRSFAELVIVLDASAIDATLGNNRLRIQLGYPTAEFFKGDDPRGDPRIRSVLLARGKLTNASESHTAWIVASLREMQTIKVGMTRVELLIVFQEEGGLSTRFQRRYVYRDCPYIKVDVRFTATEAPDEKQKEHATDRISSISQPFLEWSIDD